MKITPLDIQQAVFKVRFRGYDRREVDHFLDGLTEEVEALTKQNAAYREQLADLEIQVMEFRKKEGLLNGALVKAQELAEGFRQSTEKEAQLILRESELKAEGIVREAREHLAGLRREILDLKKEKMITIEKIRSLLHTVERLIDAESVDAPSVFSERVPGEEASEDRAFRPKP